jgi:hypothetical protein
VFAALRLSQRFLPYRCAVLKVALGLLRPQLRRPGTTNAKPSNSIRALDRFSSENPEGNTTENQPYQHNLMSKDSVIGLATSRSMADAVVQRLYNANFSYDDISVLMPDTAGTRDFAHEKHTKVPEGISTGAGTGGAIGGALGFLAGIGALTIPGIGPFIAAGPLVAALSGVGAGAAVGGIAGGLIGLGIPEYEAKQYEGKIREGNILISVHCANSDEGDRAEQILEAAGVRHVSNTSESSVPQHA